MELPVLGTRLPASTCFLTHLPEQQSVRRFPPSRSQWPGAAYPLAQWSLPPPRRAEAPSPRSTPARGHPPGSVQRRSPTRSDPIPAQADPQAPRVLTAQAATVLASRLARRKCGLLAAELPAALGRGGETLYGPRPTHQILRILPVVLL